MLGKCECGLFFFKFFNSLGWSGVGNGRSILVFLLVFYES